MKFRDGLFLLAVVLLSGCGSPPPVAQPKSEPPKPRVVVAAETKAPETPPVPEKPKMAGLQALGSTPEAAAIAPVAPLTSAPRAQAPAAAAPAPTSNGEFAEGFVGGRSISYWIGMLNSQNKTQVIEAIDALAMAREKGKPAVPKLQELAKSTDKEIAAEAEDTLKRIGQ